MIVNFAPVDIAKGTFGAFELHTQSCERQMLSRCPPPDQLGHHVDAVIIAGEHFEPDPVDAHESPVRSQSGDGLGAFLFVLMADHDARRIGSVLGEYRLLDIPVPRVLGMRDDGNLAFALGRARRRPIRDARAGWRQALSPP